MTLSFRLPYFDRFPGFEPDPRRSLNEEFQRLARFQRWNRNSDRYARERTTFLIAEFDQHLGDGEEHKIGGLAGIVQRAGGETYP